MFKPFNAFKSCERTSVHHYPFVIYAGIVAKFAREDSGMRHVDDDQFFKILRMSERESPCHRATPGATKYQYFYSRDHFFARRREQFNRLSRPDELETFYQRVRQNEF